MSAQTMLALIIILAFVIWIVQLVIIFKQAERTNDDPLGQVSGAAIFFVGALPVKIYAPDLVDRLADFWDRILGPATLERLSGGGSQSIPRLMVAGKSIPLTQDRVQIGRYENNDLVLDHPTISAYHAEVVLRPDGRHELMDRDSRNGTRINGNIVRSAILKQGEQITLGALTIHYLISSHANQSLQRTLNR